MCQLGFSSINFELYKYGYLGLRYFYFWPCYVMVWLFVFLNYVHIIGCVHLYLFFALLCSWLRAPSSHVTPLFDIFYWKYLVRVDCIPSILCFTCFLFLQFMFQGARNWAWKSEVFKPFPSLLIYTMTYLQGMHVHVHVHIYSYTYMYMDKHLMVQSYRKIILVELSLACDLLRKPNILHGLVISETKLDICWVVLSNSFLFW